MNGSARRRGSRKLVLLAMLLVPALESAAQAQSRRVPQAQGAGARRATEALGGALLPDGASFETFAPGQAPAGQPSPFAATGAAFSGTANRQIRRYRGDNNEILGDVGPSGRNVGWSPMSPASGFTLDKVHEGYYIPGFGVNGGFAAPERVWGGFYTPGWGVMGGLGNFNGPAATQNLQGGTYIPGFGVGGGPATIGNMGGPAGVGNAGGAMVGGFQPVTGGPAVSGGGSLVPGFGVTGGR